ncbi:MAG: hypothetical protein NC543_14420 [bacterium]|nr:hypothetical protein [bacterium]MCM1376536.1 hypothetical protein [Muribaculum sp.]
MERRLKSYLAQMSELLERDGLAGLDGARRRQIADGMLVQIYFFQHERLVHLIVTVTFAILTILSILGCVLCPQPSLFMLAALLLVLLVPYIRHYYILENGVQKLYTLYDRLVDTGVKVK